MPWTAFPFGFWRVSWMVFIIIFYLVLFTWSFFESVGVIYAHDGTGECGDLSEANQQALMNLPFGVDKDSAEQHRQSANRQHRRGQKLYVEAFFHIACSFIFCCPAWYAGFVRCAGYYPAFRPLCRLRDGFWGSFLVILDFFSQIRCKITAFFAILLAILTNRAYGGCFFAKICLIVSSLMPNCSPRRT